MLRLRKQSYVYTAGRDLPPAGGPAVSQREYAEWAVVGTPYSLRKVKTDVRVYDKRVWRTIEVWILLGPGLGELAFEAWGQRRDALSALERFLARR